MNCAFVNNKLYSVTKCEINRARYFPLPWEHTVKVKWSVIHGSDLPTEMIVSLDKLGQITNCRNLINFMELPTQS